METNTEVENFLQKLDKMVQAKFGGYSIKRFLILFFAFNLVAMLWVFTTTENWLAVLPQMIAIIWVLLGYNNSEKKIDATTEIEKTKIDKQPNLENT